MTLAPDAHFRTGRRLQLALIAVPIGFAIVGLLLRYAAYANLIPNASIGDFPQALCRWDCGWYIGLADHGYDPFPVPKMINAGNWAFFPLYPFAVSALRWLTGLPIMVVATAFSIVLTAIAARATWPLLQNSLRAYVLLCAFLLAGPFSVYFTTFYTEVPFFLLTVAVFVALRRKAWLWAGVFAALLSATRIVGVFATLAIILQAYLDHRQRGGTVLGFVPATLARPDLLLAIFIAPLGLFAYMAYLHFHIGDALAFSHVQRAWGRATGNPLGYLWEALTNFSAQGWPPSVSQQLGVAWLVGFVLTVVLALRRQYAMALHCLICITLPLFAGMASMLRFVVGLAPLMVIAMTLLARWRPLFYLSLVVFGIGCFYGTQGWISGVLTLV